MGVTGLLTLLKSIQKPCNIKKFAGLTLGVDAYCWLHPGTIPCAVDLALGKSSTKYVDYAMHRMRMLLHYGITPYVVFDGGYLPSKAGTEVKRAASREEAKKNGLELLRMGKATAAHQELQKAIDVTPEMARELIEELKKLNIKYVVAPYEADAQLAYLERQGLVDGIVSEDSDLLVFGAKRLITKLDKYGECVEIDRNDLTSCKTVSFFGWTDDMFRRMAILSGCDYLPGLPRMGLKTAHGLVRRHKSIDRILRAIAFDDKIKVPPGYLESYQRAELTFLHQWVFDPIQRRLVMGFDWEIESRPDDVSFIGADMDPAVAVGVATGDLHPMTKKLIKLTHKTPKKADENSHAAGRRHQQRSAPYNTPSDLKGHKKPIDSFFKPRRIPLAELDPNTLTPSPTQQELLRRHSGSFVSTRVNESNTPVQSFAAPSAGRSTGALRANRISSDLNPQPRTVPHPPKRQRLCDDSPAKGRPLPAKSAENGTSKFFSSRIPDASPSLARQSMKKNRASKIEILSDASFEESMLSLPDPEQPLKTTNRKLAIFSDSPSQDAVVPTLKSQESKAESQDGLMTQETMSTIASWESNATDETCDTSISLVPTTPPLKEKLSRSTRVNISGLHAAFGPDATAGGPADKKSGPGPSSSGISGGSALQRLGQAAVKRARVASNTSIGQSGDGEPSTDELPELSLWKTGIRSARINALCATTDVPSSSQGSEDFFVPNSEDDAPDEAVGEKDDEQKTATINFGQFAYAG